MENWNWEIGSSSKKIMQEVAQKLKNWEEVVAKKQIEQHKQELMNCLCIMRRTNDRESINDSDSGITEQSKFLVSCKRILRSCIRAQLWSDPRSRSNLHYSEFQNFVAQRFWIAAWCTEYFGYRRKRFWRTICTRRTILNSLQQFKEFGIILSGIETRYCWNSKEKRKRKENRGIHQFLQPTSKVEVACWIMMVELILTMVWWIFREFFFSELNLGKFLDSMEFQSWKVNSWTEVCLTTADPQITMHWITEVEIAKSIDELMKSRSIVGRGDFHDFDMLGAMIASALKKLLNTQIHTKESKRRKAACSKTLSNLSRKTNCVHDLRVFPCNLSLLQP